MNNPAEFGVSKPIPLRFDVDRADLLLDANIFSIVHFPHNKNGQEEAVEVANGCRFKDHAGSLTSTNVQYAVVLCCN